MKEKKMGRPIKFNEQLAMHQARNLFWKRGFTSCSVDDLCETMEITKPSFYNSFGDKRSLYMLVLKKFSSELIYNLSTIQTSHGCLYDELEDFFETLISMYTSKGKRGCFVFTTATVLTESDEEIATFLYDLTVIIKEHFKNILERASRKTELNYAFSTSETASLLLSTMLSLSVQARIGIPISQLRKTYKLSLRSALIERH